MQNATSLYSALLKFYPQSYRKLFGDQMMQTFIDTYQDVEQLEGHVSMSFWISTVTDEIKNITEQHMTSLTKENALLKGTVFKLVVSTVLFIPLYAVFYAALVNGSLALPHPQVSGIGVMLALAALLLLPGILSVLTSYVLASACISMFSKGKVSRVRSS